MTAKKFKNIALDGLLTNNPTLRLVLGTCPTLALTTAAMNGIGIYCGVIHRKEKGRKSRINSFLLLFLYKSIKTQRDLRKSKRAF